jgi:adenylate cyclase
MDATILVVDARDFHALAERSGAVELGLLLTGFYEHVAGGLEAQNGKIVKFIGDGVLASFDGADHRGRALAAPRAPTARRAAWLDESARLLAALDWSAGAASGAVLVGELGTERVHFRDVLGAPVNLAFRLAALATDRKLGTLVDEDTFAGAQSKPPCVEVDAAELGGRRRRLYRVEA